MNNCSRCGASNPETNKFCGNCGQLLIAAAPPPSAPSSDELPEWLRSTDEPPVTGVASANTSGAVQSDLPTWLSDVGVEDNSAQLPPPPDWLAQLQQSPPAPTASSSNDELPEWLREDTSVQQAPGNNAEASPAWPSVRGEGAGTSDSSSDDLPPWLRSDDQPAAPVATVSTSSSGELPEWLQSDDVDVAPSIPASGSQADLPQWMRSDAVSEAPAPAASSNELPRWLQSDDLPSMPQETTRDPDDGPDWLRETEPAELSQPAAATSSDLPSWLGDAETHGAQQNTSLHQSNADDALPAWLRDSEPTVESTPTSSNGVVSADGPASADQLPAWLQTSDALPGSTQQTNNGLPAWLDDGTETPSELAQSPAAPSSGTSSLPAWLLDEPPSDTAAAETHRAQVYDTTASSDVPAWLADTPSNDASTSDVEMPVPNWASEFGEAPPATAPNQIGLQDSEQLPSWLNDDSSTPALPPQAQSDADGLPAWLVEESPTSAPTAATTQSFAALSGQAPSNDELPPWLADDTAAANTLSHADTEELPSWLAHDSAAPAASTVPSSADTSELPSWLTDSAPTDAPSSPPSLSTDNPQMTQELPSWLLDQPVNSAAPTVSSTDGAANDELPPWLQSADAPLNTQAMEQTPSAVPGANDDLPAWLQESDEPLPANSEGLPSWLGLPDEPASEQHTAQVYDSASSEDLPPWLSADDTAPAAATDQIHNTANAPVAPESAPSNQSVELPTWLNESDTPTAQTQTSSDLPPWLSGMPEESTSQAQSTTGLPSWLDEPDQPASESGKTDDGQSELLGGLDLPAWLREESAPRPATPAPEVAPNWLQRVTPEAEEAAPVVVEDVPPRPRVVRTPERLAAANMLQQMMTEPVAEPIPQPVKRRRSRVLTIVLALVALLIIGALLAVLLNGRFGLNFGVAPAPSAMVSATAQIVSGLPAGRPVLLAYEWDAQRIGELRPLEDVVVGQLATRTDVPLIFVSTDPQGTLLATERTVQLASINDNFHDQYGLGYVNLGFKAGGPLALRRFADNAAFGALFAQDASGIDLRANDVTMTSMCGGPTADGCSWDNVSLLVVMADEANDVRVWFEQVRSEHPGLQTLLLTSAEIGPEVQPYAATANVSLLAGLRDAEAYAQMIGAPSERIGRQLDATALGGALFAAAIVIGGIPALITGRRARRFDGDDQMR